MGFPMNFFERNGQEYLRRRASGKPPRILGQILSLNDFEEQARRLLPRPIFGYISSAAEDGQSFQNNWAALRNHGFVTRVLRDVSQRSQVVELFGEKYTSPFGIAPMGINALSTYRCDQVLANSASQAGIVSIMSGASLMPMEMVAMESPRTWFQAYLPSQWPAMEALMDRVANAGFKTLVITVDIPVHANRENSARSGFGVPLRPSFGLAWDGVTRPRWLLNTLLRTIVCDGMPHFENLFATRGSPILSAKVANDFAGTSHLSWEHLAGIRKHWKGNLVIKGILSVSDALLAKNCGADGVIVSNHGGRQLDGAVAPLDMLEGVVKVVGSHYPVMVDGGFRRGSDILKALALGAKMVFIGRPFNYAAAVASQAGVMHAIQLLHDEIDRNMAMMGVTNCSQIDEKYMVRINGGGH